MTATHEAIVQDFPGVGVLFPRFFDDGRDYYAEFMAAHAPQALTESNKDGVALRKWLYTRAAHQSSAPPQQGSRWTRTHCSSQCLVGGLGVWSVLAVRSAGGAAVILLEP